MTLMENYKIGKRGFIIAVIVVSFLLSSFFFINRPNTETQASPSHDHAEVETIETPTGWTLTWGGAETDRAFAIGLDSSEHIYIAGQTMSFGVSQQGMNDICLVKYNNSGVQVWNLTWGGEYDENCYALGIDSKDNMYLAGYTTSFGLGGSDAVVLKYNSFGILQWSRLWGGADLEIAYDLAIDEDDNVFVCGRTTSFSDENGDIFLVKYDKDGNQLWNGTWGSGNASEKAHAIGLDSTGNIYLAGYIYSISDEHSDCALVKFDAGGVYLWNRTWGGMGDEMIYDIVIGESDNIYLGGYTTSYDAKNSDFVVLKWNSSGSCEWNLTWGGSEFDEAHGIELDSFGNLYLAGFLGEAIALVKYSNEGLFQNSKVWSGNGGYKGHSVMLDASDRVFIAGETTQGMGNGDMCILYEPFF